MGKPAARLGDTTVHGGTIVAGCMTVLIGGKPAARVGDAHVCPMVTPGTPPVPHVGMPIAPPGSAPTVLIGGQPAATVGDMAPCTGPPDMIAPPGCPTVLIGAGGGGGFGMGQSGTGSSVKGKSDGSGEGGDKSGQSEESSAEPETHFLHVDFKDKGGFPISGLGYKVKAPGGYAETGVINGPLKMVLEQSGDSEIRLFGVKRIGWSESKVRVGAEVKMQVELVGIESGAKAKLGIFVRDQNGAPLPVAWFDATVQDDRIEETWAAALSPEQLERQQEVMDKGGFSTPYFYFSVLVDGYEARSGLLMLLDDARVRLLDEAGQPVADTDYVMRLANGEVRKGKLDKDGRAEQKDVPAGTVRTTFPVIPLKDE